ncbi:MAG: MBL fold metallo-hydrolase [Erysipelotrichaceae bacterium]|nr:MBL fold metallo-hydrolase [Erysipelotrichaceae bacterium]MBR5049214.1 MBL fold metallo-hydrolase [Erysipelotrichaceae bacterium]
MYFYILASGSKGNCAVVGSGDTRIIIDCGPSVSYLKDSFEKIGVDYRKCDGLLITHSHTDHIKSVRMFADLPVYAPFPILALAHEKIIDPYKPFTIGCLTIVALALSHDCDICVGYVITDGKETLVQITDTGYISQANMQLIRGADYYIFESNHDPEMLMNTDRPDWLKKRILSDSGHMSNEYASDMISRAITDRTKQVILAHISQEANDYDLAYYTLKNLLVSRRQYRPDLYVRAIEQFEIYCSQDH